MMQTCVLIVLVSGMTAVLKPAAAREAVMEEPNEPLHLSNNLPSMHSDRFALLVSMAYNELLMHMWTSPLFENRGSRHPWLTSHLPTVGLQCQEIVAGQD